MVHNKETYKKVAEELGLSEDMVKHTYMAYWKFIRHAIQQLPLKTEMSENEFGNLRTCFNIPSLGKLYCTFDRYKRVNARFHNIKNFIKNYDKDKQDKTNVHGISDNNGCL